jgi:hypothetical protein
MQGDLIVSVELETAGWNPDTLSHLIALAPVLL